MNDYKKNKDYELCVVEKYTQGWRAFHEIMRVALFEQSPWEYDPEFNDRYFVCPAQRTSYLLMFKGGPVAAACLDQTGIDRAVLRGVAVAKHLQGHGHGRALVALVAEAAGAAGVSELCVNAAKTKIDFYRAVGFCQDEWGPEEQARSRCELPANLPMQMTLRLHGL